MRGQAIFNYTAVSIDCPGVILLSDPDRHECFHLEEEWESQEEEEELWDRDLDYLEYLESVIIPINETDACYIESCESKIFIWGSVYDAIPAPGTGVTCLAIGGGFMLCVILVFLVLINSGKDDNTKRKTKFSLCC